ncbi:hypothetical protein VPHD164_0012 [Vibrio phage D164]
MLKLSTQLRRVLFQLEDGKETVDLYVSQYTVADANKMVNIQRELVNEEGNITEYGAFVASRIVCSVKRVDNDEHYWPTIEDFEDKGYPNELMTQLDQVVNEVNPIPDTPELEKGESLLEQKKS